MTTINFNINQSINQSGCKVAARSQNPIPFSQKLPTTAHQATPMTQRLQHVLYSMCPMWHIHAWVVRLSGRLASQSTFILHVSARHVQKPLSCATLSWHATQQQRLQNDNHKHNSHSIGLLDWTQLAEVQLLPHIIDMLVT